MISVNVNSDSDGFALLFNHIRRHFFLDSRVKGGPILLLKTELGQVRIFCIKQDLAFRESLDICQDSFHLFKVSFSRLHVESCHGRVAIC